MLVITPAQCPMTFIFAYLCRKNTKITRYCKKYENLMEYEEIIKSLSKQPIPAEFDYALYFIIGEYFTSKFKEKKVTM